MSYHRGMGTMYAAAGLGTQPTGISPPFRRYGFRSFDGLGAIDRLAENRTRTFVFSIDAVRGLSSSADAPLVTRRITEYMTSNGLLNAETGWAEGGRIWGRFTLGVGNPLLTASAERRAKLVKALGQAAVSIGSSVSFEVAGYGRVPSGASSSAPTTSGGVVTLPTIDIEGTVPRDTVSALDLQTILKSKGFNPGSLDGKWGPITAGALNQAATAAARSLQAGEAIGSADKRSVTLPTAVWSAVQGLPARQMPTVVAPSAPAITVTDIAPETNGGLPDWLPWTIGATALLGVGGYFIWKGRKKGGSMRAVAANRRRHRRSSRRRTSRRR